LDLTTERRLCHMHTLGRAPEVQFLSDGYETLELLEIEH
jgi:hypothetical protein